MPPALIRAPIPEVIAGCVPAHATQLRAVWGRRDVVAQGSCAAGRIRRPWRASRWRTWLILSTDMVLTTAPARLHQPDQGLQPGQLRASRITPELLEQLDDRSDPRRTRQRRIRRADPRA
jgi:hypothetical protein